MHPFMGVCNPLGLEFTRHSLEEEIFLCVGFSLSPSAPFSPQSILELDSLLTLVLSS